MRHQRRATDSSSHSDLLDDESSSYPAVGGGVEVAEPSTIMSRSFDARSLDFLSDTNSGTSGAAGSSSDGQHSRSSAFSRTSRSRHSADQYLPMTASSTTTKISVSPFLLLLFDAVRLYLIDNLIKSRSPIHHRNLPGNYRGCRPITSLFHAPSAVLNRVRCPVIASILLLPCHLKRAQRSNPILFRQRSVVTSLFT